MIKPDDLYRPVIEFLLTDVGINFTDTETNISAIGKHLGANSKQVRAVLQTMSRRGLVRYNRREGMWTVVQASEAA